MSIPQQPNPNREPDLPLPDWDLTVLQHPVVLDIPDDLPTDHFLDADPLLHASIQAVALTLERDPSAHARIGDLGRAGVVALRTSNGSLELHETLLGWVLVHVWGDPDRYDLATAAHLRAHRLANERRTGCGAPDATPAKPDHTHHDSGDGRNSTEGDPGWGRR